VNDVKMAKKAKQRLYHGDVVRISLKSILSFRILVLSGDCLCSPLIPAGPAPVAGAVESAVAATAASCKRKCIMGPPAAVSEKQRRTAAASCSGLRKPEKEENEREEEDDLAAAAELSLPALGPKGRQVMIGYRKSDTGRVEDGGDGTVTWLSLGLEKAGYSVFVGENALTAGQEWTREIQAAVKECQVFVALCSPDYGNTKWTLREIQMADNNGKMLLPVWHSGAFPPAAVEIFLSGTQRVPEGNLCIVDGLASGSVGQNNVLREIVACLSDMGIRPRG
jgi:hypothetical protein